MNKKRPFGFTLTELIVTCIVIGILAAIATPIMSDYIENSKGVRAIGNLRMIASCARLYYNDFGTANFTFTDAFDIMTTYMRYGLSLDYEDFNYSGNQANANYYFQAVRTSGRYVDYMINITKDANNDDNMGGNWPWIYQ